MYAIAKRNTKIGLQTSTPIMGLYLGHQKENEMKASENMLQEKKKIDDGN